MKVTLIGIVAASPVSFYFMQEWLTDFAVKTSMGPGLFPVSIIIGAPFSVCIVSVQTVKASWLNPVKSLKSELSVKNLINIRQIYKMANPNINH